MKKKIIASILCIGLAATMMAGCGKKESEETGTAAGDIATPIETTVDEEPVEEEETEVAEEEPGVKILKNEDAPAGYVYNELTGLLIDESLKDQRPIAAMVDNELVALDHYGLNEADMVVEMMNSTENNRITRLMVFVKDWEKIERMGNIRSARTTNCILAAEWNAILCHDGGPVYINEYVALPTVDHLSGVFSRIDNGKPSWYTEYMVKSDLEKYLKNQDKIDLNYNEYYTGDHFTFAEENALDANEYLFANDAVGTISLPFPHNKSELHYNATTNLYEYYEYDAAHVDAESGEVLGFRNVILQRAPFKEYDPNGYLWYDLGGEGVGYYVTDGKFVPITWEKPTWDNINSAEMLENTVFKDTAGNPIVLNAGNVYLGIIPADTWDTIVIE